MTRHKVSELEGVLLDAAVALADDRGPIFIVNGRAGWWVSDGGLSEVFEAYAPSTDWSVGGPIIERERIMIHPSAYSANWGAFIERKANWSDYCKQSGPTPLIAAMRARVASKFGEYVDLPSAAK